VDIRGHCDERFAAVREALAQNLREDDGNGQSVSVAVGGDLVVDLWGGDVDAGRRTRWGSDLLAPMMSVGKAIAAVCALHLVGRGALDLDAPVSRYWPEFGENGKGAITVRQVLGHHAGLPVVTGLDAARGLSVEAVTAALAREAPHWEPGTVGGYHSYTYGFLVGELVRRASGLSLGEYVRRRIGPVIGEEYYFGLSAAEQARCVAVRDLQASPLFAMMCDTETLLGRLWEHVDLRSVDFNAPEYRSAELASLNGHGTTRAVARIYGMLAGRQGLLPDHLVDQMLSPAWEGTDGVLGWPLRMGLGVMLENEAMPFLGTGSGFGQPGANGATAFGDVQSGVGFCWTPARISGLGLDDPYPGRLVDAVRSSLGVAAR
jgi:CubicO group peptidase (beta-lactamase class C family)